MLHHAFFDADAVEAHAPFFGSRRDQPGARLGACLAKLIPGIRHRRRTPVALHLSELEIVVYRGVRRRRLHSDLRPVGIDLVGENGSDTGIGTLSELDMLADDSNGVVRRNTE